LNLTLKHEKAEIPITFQAIRPVSSTPAAPDPDEPERTIFK